MSDQTEVLRQRMNTVAREGGGVIDIHIITPADGRNLSEGPLLDAVVEAIEQVEANGCGCMLCARPLLSSRLVTFVFATADLDAVTSGHVGWVVCPACSDLPDRSRRIHSMIRSLLGPSRRLGVIHHEAGHA